MTLLPTFGFKGMILPILDKNDKMYMFLKNDCDNRVLLNLVSMDINKFVDLGPKSSKIVSCGSFKDGLQIKVFYMGQELFDYQSHQIEKSAMLLYSDYVMKNDMELDTVSFNISFVNGCEITSHSVKPQQLFIKIVDKDSNEIVHEEIFVSGEPYHFKRKYFINYDITIFNINGQIVFKNQFDLNEKIVFIWFDTKELQNTLAWIPYVEEFQMKHNCKLLCLTHWNHLLIEEYPSIQFVSPTTTIDKSSLYATYRIGMSIPHDILEIKEDYRDISLQRVASSILGLADVEIKPKILLSELKREISEEYVVISTSALIKAKLWNNPSGWQEVVDYLNFKGFKVVLLQKEKEDRLKNLINLSGIDDYFYFSKIIRYCKFFVGVSSDLSWLAWALNKQVIMIGGCTNEKTEFQSNNHRVINKSVCHGCWNDKEITFEKDWFWCPRNKNFECSTSISSLSVINKINKILT